MNKRIGFFSNQLGLRGTEVSMFDYAKYNKEILGNESFIIVKNNVDQNAADKFLKEFQAVYIANNITDLYHTIDDLKLDFLYKTCAGDYEEIPDNCPVGIHAVFRRFEPFGSVYAYISEYLRNVCVPKDKIQKYDYVPYMVTLPNEDGDLRKELNLSKDDLVFGYHGGRDSFNIDFVKQTIAKVAAEKKNIKFIFMNVDQFVDHENVLFLPGTSDMVYKVKFINTCNAMIHARNIGETFGLSCAEFSFRNKPVITCSYGLDLCHLHILKHKAIIYSNGLDLYKIFTNFKDYVRFDEYDCYSSKFNPTTVMKRFEKVFLL